MKRIAAVVRPEKLEPLKEALFQAKISGMTIYQVHGCGNQHGVGYFLVLTTQQPILFALSID